MLTHLCVRIFIDGKLLLLEFNDDDNGEWGIWWFRNGCGWLKFSWLFMNGSAVGVVWGDDVLWRSFKLSLKALCTASCDNTKARQN